MAFLVHMAEDTHSYTNSSHVSGIKDLTTLMSYYCNTRNFKNTNIQNWARLGTILGYDVSIFTETAISLGQNRSVTVGYNPV